MYRSVEKCEKVKVFIYGFVCYPMYLLVYSKVKKNTTVIYKMYLIGVRFKLEA